MKQEELQFETPKTPREMTLEELREEYRKQVGVPPRTDDMEDLLAALTDPAAEYARLAEEDKASDLEEIEKTYQRKKV